MKRGAFAALCVVLAIGFAALGVWQVERLAWKRALIATVDARVHASPASLPVDWHGDHAYRRVRVAGVFLHDRETFVQAVTVHGPGWWVLTPLVMPGPSCRGPAGDAPAIGVPDGACAGRPPSPQTILVNRGFVPTERRAPATRVNPTGSVSVTGLLRRTEPDGAFLRTNDATANRWYSRDTIAIARARHIAGLPYFIDADASPNPGGFPIGGLTVIAFRNNHLMYAITWFGLAALCMVGTALVLRSGERRE